MLHRLGMLPNATSRLSTESTDSFTGVSASSVSIQSVGDEMEARCPGGVVEAQHASSMKQR
jgi:hypothetical protein